MTADRLIHLGVALLIWAAFVAWRARGRRPVGSSTPGGRERAELVLLPFVMLGAAVPDWDLWVGGIGFHRSPLFHSALPVVVGALLLRRVSRWAVPVGLALGVASHLLWDIVQYGDVRWIRGGNADRLFLLVNAALLLVFAGWWRPGGGGRSTPDNPPRPPADTDPHEPDTRVGGVGGR